MDLLRHTKLIAKAGLAKVRRAVLGPWATAVLCDSPVNGKILVPAEDVGVGRRLAFDGAYDPDRVELLVGLVEPGEKVLVLGAHVGALVVPLARRAAAVVALEANPGIFELLQANLRLNDLTNVEAHNLAAVDRPGKERFLLSRVNSGGSKVAPLRDRFLYRYDGPREVEVEGVAVDGLLPGERFALVVMDIEGSEHRAALGMERVLRGARFLLVEFVPHHLRDVAGIEVEAWAAPFADAFPRFSSLDGRTEDGRRWRPSNELVEHLRGLYANDVSADLLLGHESQGDAG